MKKLYLVLLIISYGCTSNAQLQDNYDISVSPNGLITMPYTQGAFSTFVKYTKIQAPNGQAIHFIAQNAITEAQIVRARNILQFYLTNFSGSQYGSDKTVVINQMGTNEAILMLLNGSDGDVNPPNVNGQPLYQNEMAVEGHSWYINNDYDNHRDASFEEILHMMHDTGIGVDGANTQPGALPAYQSEIRAAQQNAILNNFAIWPIGANSGGTQQWYNELAAENSLSQEYLAALVDSYYGLWEPWTENASNGMWGLYISKTREEIETEDPFGWVLMPKYFSPFININMDIDPTFAGIFNMTETPSQPYTYKSQYLQHITLTGSNASGIKGNAEANILNGNDSNNTIEGVAGNDTVDCKGGAGDKILFSGNFLEYTTTVNGNIITIQDNTENRDGTDTATNCEILKFADQEILASTLNTEEFELSNVIKMFPNPSNDSVVFQLNGFNFDTVKINIYDSNGRLVQESNYSSNTIEINTSSFAKGIYMVELKKDQKSLFNKKLVIK